MPKSTKAYASDAGNARKNVPQALSQWRWQHNEAKKEMVRLSLDLLPVLSDPWNVQHPVRMAGAALFLHPADHLSFRRQ